MAWCRLDGTVEKAKITELYVTEALEQVPAESAGPGEIVSVAGLAEVTIGETLADPDRPVALPAITVDEPSLAMTIGINTSPLSGSDGTKLTARLLKARLDAELVGNVAIRVANTDRPDMWEVLGRGELQLAVLVETMRREGFELTVGKPQVVTREIDGKVYEPVERVSVDVPDEYLGVVTQLLALRKGTMLEMVNHGIGLGALRLPGAGPWPDRVPHRVPDRHPGHRHPPPRVRRLGALARRPADQAQRVDGGRPARRHHHVRPHEPPRARHADRRAGRGGLRGHDRRGERPGGGDGRQPDQGEEAEQHPFGDGGGLRAAHARHDVLAGARAGVHQRGRVRRGHAQGGTAAQGAARPGDPGPATQPGPGRRRSASRRSKG